MLKKFILLIFISFSIFAACVTPKEQRTPPLAGSAKCDAPAWHAGEWWIYKTPEGEGGMSVESVIPEGYLLKLGSRALIRDKATLNTTFIIEKGQKIKAEGLYRRVLDFPLFIGKKWREDSDFVGVTTPGTRISGHIEYEVEALTEIETPAGKFEAYRIAAMKMLTGGGILDFTREKIWYAPAVKNWVKWEYEVIDAFLTQKPIKNRFLARYNIQSLSPAMPHLQKGEKCLAEKDYARAVEEFDKAINLDPNCAEAYTGRGEAYRHRREYALAIYDFNKAIILKPNLDIAYWGRGVVNDLQGNHNQAIEDFDKAIDLALNPANAINSRGVAYRNKGEYDRAIEDFTKAISLAPKIALAYSNRAEVYQRKGEYGNALADYNKALELSPSSAAAYNQLAWFLATAADPAICDGRRAVELAHKACELSGWKNGSYIDTLAAAYARIGDFESAVKMQKKALEFPELAQNKEMQERIDLYKKGITYSAH